MTEHKIPTWLRIANAILGSITIIVAFIVILLPSLAISTLILIVALGLLLLGLARILRAAFREEISSFFRFLNVIAGLLILVLALVVLLFQTLFVLTLIWILAIALVVLGIVRVFVGLIDKELPTWLRILVIVVGLITIVLSFLIFLQPSLGELTLVIFIAWTLLTNGITRIAKAIVGVK